MNNSEANDIYEVIGKLTVGYSQLEYWTEHILTLMIAQNDFMVEPLLVRPLSFSRKIEMIKRCLNYHFSENIESKKKHKTLFDKIDNMRILRNRLIHGDWVIEKNNNSVIVRNYKLQYHKDKDYWTDLEEDRYTTVELNEKLKELKEVLKEIEDFAPEYKALETRPWLENATQENIENFKKEIRKLIDEEA